MKRLLALTALSTAVASTACAAPALADGAASTRNIFVLGASALAAVGVTNYTHKRHLMREQQAESERREASYKAFYYRKYGAYPTSGQVHSWYVKTYGVEPV